MNLSRPLKVDGYRDSRAGDTIYEIFTMDDFPAPVSGVRTLPSGIYEIQNDLVTADRFEIPASGSVTFTMKDQRYNIFEYTGSDALFSGIGYTQLEISRVQIKLSGNNSKLFDLDGGGGIVVGSFNFRTGAVRFTGTGCSIGEFKNSACRINDMFSDGFSDGMTIENPTFGLIEATILQGAAGGTPTYISVLGGNTQYFGAQNTNIFIEDTGHNIFYIEPVVKGIVSIKESPSSTGLGNYFKQGTTGPIASFTDISTSTTAVTVTNDGGDALFTSTGHGLNVGETAVHTTFSESSYNGDHVVTEITANTYKVGLSYVSDDSGLFETTTCQVNDVGHGLSNGTSLSIFGTINFNGGYKIFNVQTDTFEITLGKAFPGSETTGNWDTGSLEGSNSKRSKYVTTSRNGNVPDSKIIGSALVGGNATETVITTQDVFYNLNLNASMVQASNNELWTLTNSTTGEMRYDGLVNASLNYGGQVAAYSGGVSEIYELQLLKNGTPLSSPDNVNIPLDVGAAIRSSPITWAIQAEPGDLFRMQIANTEGTSNITFDTVKIVID